MRFPGSHTGKQGTKRRSHGALGRMGKPQVGGYKGNPSDAYSRHARIGNGNERCSFKNPAGGQCLRDARHRGKHQSYKGVF